MTCVRITLHTKHGATHTQICFHSIFSSFPFHFLKKCEGYWRAPTWKCWVLHQSCLQHHLWKSQEKHPDNICGKSLCDVLCVAEASSSPVALWDQEAFPDHWLHHQLQQAGGLRHCQLCYPKQIRICPAHQNQLSCRDPRIGSSQLSPVHLEVAYELGRVVPAQSGVEVQEGGGGLWWGAGTTQPHHVINAQTLNQLRRHLQAAYIQELVGTGTGQTRTIKKGGNVKYWSLSCITFMNTKCYILSTCCWNFAVESFQGRNTESGSRNANTAERRCVSTEWSEDSVQVQSLKGVFCC